MPDLFFKVFRSPKDHDNWDKQIEYYFKSTDLSVEEKGDVVAALEYYKKHFSNGFLKNTKFAHPIKHHIANKAKHSTEWLIWLYKTMLSFENNERNFDVIKRKVNKLKEATIEGIPFLEIGSPLEKNGFNVEFEPQMIIEGFNGNPDMRITNVDNSEVLYIEVSTLFENKEMERMSSDYLKLNSFMEGRRIRFAGRIHEPMSNADLRILEFKIKQLVRKCLESNKLKSLTLEETENKLELAISKDDKIDALQEWANKRALRINEIQSQSITMESDIDKIINSKILKSKQIPLESFGFIYLKVMPLFFLTLNPKKIIAKLEKQILQYENIFGLVLWTDIGGKVDQPFGFKLGSNFICEFPIFGIMKRVNLFVLNKNCTHKISANSLHKIFLSLETH